MQNWKAEEVFRAQLLSCQSIGPDEIQSAPGWEVTRASHIIGFSTRMSDFSFAVRACLSFP